MKKKIKIALITAASLLLVALVAAVIAVFAGNVLALKGKVDRKNGKDKKDSHEVNEIVDDKESADDMYIVDRDIIVCFTTEHGEPNPAEMGNVLSDAGITPTTVSLKIGEVPEGCELLYIISPIYDFTAEEIECLDNYLDRGGSVQIAVEPYLELPNLESYLKEWGITFGNNVIAEGDPNYASMDTSSGLDVIFPQAENTEINSELLKSENRVFAALCRSVDFDRDLQDEINCERVLRTTRYGAAFEYAYDESGESNGLSEPEQGTYALAMYLEKAVDNGRTAKLLVAGSSTFWGASQYASAVGLDISGLLSEDNYGNRAFFLGSTYAMLGVRSDE